MSLPQDWFRVAQIKAAHQRRKAARAEIESQDSLEEEITRESNQADIDDVRRRWEYFQANGPHNPLAPFLFIASILRTGKLPKVVAGPKRRGYRVRIALPKTSEAKKAVEGNESP